MVPVLGRFSDQVLFLKHNLNASAIAELDTHRRQLQSEIAQLIAEMEARSAKPMRSSPPCHRVRDDAPHRSFVSTGTAPALAQPRAARSPGPQRLRLFVRIRRRLARNAIALSWKLRLCPYPQS